MTGLPADDRAVLDRAEAAATNGQVAAEGVAATVGTLAGLVRDLIGHVAQARDSAALAVVDGDHPNGATYLVTGLAAAKTWIVDGDQMSDLLNRFPWLRTETWSGETLSKIPTIGPDPDPPSRPAD
jgi:hypothetical protein